LVRVFTLRVEETCGRCRCHRDAADAPDAPPLANPRRFSPLIAPKLMCDTGSRRFLDHKSCNTSQWVRNTGCQADPPKLAMNSASISLFVLSVLTSPPPSPHKTTRFGTEEDAGDLQRGAAIPAPRSACRFVAKSWLNPQACCIKIGCSLDEKNGHDTVR